MRIPKKITVTLSLAALVFIGVAAMRPNDDEFKNLKVLPKNITADSLMAIMDYWGRSLSVGCDHCHVMKDANGKEDYASDAVHDKEEARKMFLMTDSINKQYFPRRNPNRPAVQKVTCYTCHHGKAHPDRNPQ